MKVESKDIKEVVNESNKSYHANKDYISKSMLQKMAICPKYFKWCLENENEEDRSESLVMGSAFHKLVLEPQEFGKEFVVMPKIDKRTKIGRETYEEFLTTVGERDILTEEQFAVVRDMAEEILCNDLASTLLNGFCEHSMYGVDEVTGEKIKTRPDCFQYIDDTLIITDLKSCRSAMTEDFIRDCVKYGYDLQAYMYTYNLSQVLDIPMSKIEFIFIAVEKTPPYLINVLKVSDEMLARGELLYRKYIGMYHEAKTTNNWWGLNGKHNILDLLTLPNYLKGDDKDE